jgi:predicted amidohydrolase YtcJ
VPVASGSDFPVEEPAPLPGFYAAVTRQDASGQPAAGWYPDQRMTREEALRSWTLTGAWAAFEEGAKGSLEPGKFADFVLLSADILRIPAPEILKTRVLMTVVGGEIVYSDPSLEAPSK